MITLIANSFGIVNRVLFYFIIKAFAGKWREMLTGHYLLSIPLIY